MLASHLLHFIYAFETQYTFTPLKHAQASTLTHTPTHTNTHTHKHTHTHTHTQTHTEHSFSPGEAHLLLCAELHCSVTSICTATVTAHVPPLPLLLSLPLLLLLLPLSFSCSPSL